MIAEGEIAGQRIRIKLNKPETIKCFKGKMKEAEGTEWDVSVSEERYELYRSKMAESVPDEYVEFQALIGLVSLELLKQRKCIFHGVALMYKGKAWILTAPSGTGKTTQYENWKRRHPEEIRVINGDKPILELTEDGEIYVCPSPWVGKEGYSEEIRAPLGGVVYLKQGRENRIVELSAAEGAEAVFRQFLVRPEKREEVVQLSAITDMIFRKYPVKGFENNGTEESTEELRKMIMKYGG